MIYATFLISIYLDIQITLCSLQWPPACTVTRDAIGTRENAMTHAVTGDATEAIIRIGVVNGFGQVLLGYPAARGGRAA